MLPDGRTRLWSLDSSTCTAAEVLLNDLATDNKLSPEVARELIGQYTAAIASSVRAVDPDAMSKVAREFEGRASRTVQFYRNALVRDSSAGSRLALAILLEEVSVGKRILQGLYPCTTAPINDLKILASWTASRDSEADLIKHFEQDRESLQKAKLEGRLARSLQLNMWPFVLLIALSLKFAKGVAAVRRKGPQPPNDGVPDVSDGADVSGRIASPEKRESPRVGLEANNEPDSSESIPSTVPSSDELPDVIASGNDSLTATSESQGDREKVSSDPGGRAKEVSSQEEPGAPRQSTT